MLINDSHHEVFSYLIVRCAEEPYLLNDYLRYFDRLMPLMKVARLASPVVNACFNQNNKRFAFYTTRYKQLMEGLDSNSLVLFGKPQELPYAINKGISFYPAYDFVPDLFELFRCDPQLRSDRALKLIDACTTMLVKMSPEYLVVWNDALFLERFLLFCGRRAGVKSICIQHGIFHDEYPCDLLDGYYADYMFVWGKSQADLYKDPDFDKGKLRILGYPFIVDSFVCSKTNTVCIFGENLEIAGNESGLKKKRLYEEIAALLRRNAFEVVYKPHPFELNRAYIPENIKIVPDALNAALAKYDRFIALTSTALLQATLHGNIAIQYYDASIGGSDFSTKGYSYTTRNMEEIPFLLHELKKPSIIAEDAILLSRNPGQRFLSLVETLGQQTAARSLASACY